MVMQTDCRGCHSNVTEQDDQSEDADIVCAIEEQQLDCLPIQAGDIQKATMQDPLLSQVGGQHHPNHYQTRSNHFSTKDLS